MQTIEQLEQTIAGLEAKRASLAERAGRISVDRREVGFEAFAEDDPKAKARLAKLNDEFTTIAGNIESLDGALGEARKRLAAARHAEASKQDHRQAAELRQAFDHFVELAETMDQALATVVATSNAMQETVNKIHVAGSISPTGQQLLSLGTLSLNSALMGTIWKRAFEHLPPHQRRTFSELVTGWRDGAKPAIVARLGEQPKEEAA